MTAMNSSEIKKLLISSLNTDGDTTELSARLEREGISYDFSEDFTDKVLNKIYETKVKVSREVDFVKSLNIAFYRMLSRGCCNCCAPYFNLPHGGLLSFNSFLGLSDSYDETIVSLLTGN